MTSDHLIFAPRCFSEVLAPVSTYLVQHGYIPPVFRDAVILPIPKCGNMIRSQSANYRGIALASCFSKLRKNCILEDIAALLSPSIWFQNRVVYHIVHWCAEGNNFHGGSCVYGCLVDASKAFDTVDHTLLLEKLLKRDLPLCVVHFLLTWHQMRVSWNGVQSDTFPVSRGVRQGV